MNLFIKTRQKALLDIALEWLNSKENVKIQTYQKYENTINNYIKDNIGQIPIKKINNNTVKSFFSDLEANDISESTQKTILFIIKATLTFGLEENYYNKLNLNNIKISNSKTKINIFTTKEQVNIENYLKENINIRKLCVLLCLYTGLRVGEVCGLKWEDIDFNNKTLEVKRTIQRIKNNNFSIKKKTILIESTPKSDSSNRIVPIADFLIPLLQKLKTYDNYFLLSNSEKLYDPRGLEAFYSRVLKKCNIKQNNFHTLRHTFATRSIEANMDIKTLSELLGHSKIETTLKLYVHPSLDLKKDSIEDIVNFMSLKKVKL